MQHLPRLALALALLAPLTGVPALAQSQKTDQVITVAIVGEPPTLDPAASTADVVSIVTQHMFETLFTFDGKWQVRPLLAAEMPTISEGGKVYDIALRTDVPFQDGSKMTADDVVASLDRWLKIASRGKSVADNVSSVEKEDASHVKITLKQPYSPLLSLLAFTNSAAVIVPKADINDDGSLKDLIGTGPYKLAEHKPDQYIRLARFDGYVSRTEPSDGSFGLREQVPAEIRFVPVPDANTRAEGAISGQFDFADQLPAEALDRLKASAKSEPVIQKPFGWPIFAFNLKKGLMTNLDIRRAVEAALAPGDMLEAAFGSKDFYSVDGALYPDGWVWHSDKGLELYDQHDTKKAAELLKKAGYDGTPLRILTSHQYEFHFQMAEVAKAYLEQAGFKVELDVVDWATLTTRRNNPDLWDIYTTHSPFLPEPALNADFYASAREGWTYGPKDDALKAFNTETDPKKRAELWGEIQGYMYDQAAPLYKVGDFNALLAKAKGMTGLANTPWPFFWNATKAD